MNLQRTNSTEELHESRERTAILMTGLELVQQWPDRMMVDDNSAASDGRTRPHLTARELAFAQQDVSPTRFTRYSTEALFVREDPRRAADGAGGRGRYPFGTDWRRDGDDDDYGRGTWTLWWLATTHETVLECRGRRWELWLLGTAITSFDQAQSVLHSIEPLRTERNSLALVLHAYRAVDERHPEVR